jgi:hypothetical protein
VLHTVPFFVLSICIYLTTNRQGTGERLKPHHSRNIFAEQIAVADVVLCQLQRGGPMPHGCVYVVRFINQFGFANGSEAG